MAYKQDRMANPFSMDEGCTRCPELVETRGTIVHGYGDVAADFLFVLEAPTALTDRCGHPVDPEPDRHSLAGLLDACGFLGERTDGADQPVLDDAFLTHLARCHHPDRPPSDDEVDACEPFLNAEIRTINPEILLPVGQRSLRTLAPEFTTNDPADLDIEADHARSVRGRGFELIPIARPSDLDDAAFQAAVDRIESTQARDYRQTKGRRER